MAINPKQNEGGKETKYRVMGKQSCLSTEAPNKTATEDQGMWKKRLKKRLKNVYRSLNLVFKDREQKCQKFQKVHAEAEDEKT